MIVFRWLLFDFAAAGLAVAELDAADAAMAAAEADETDATAAVSFARAELMTLAAEPATPMNSLSGLRVVVAACPRA